MNNQKSVRHLLGISGGKDSAALAIYMRDKVPEMKYSKRDWVYNPVTNVSKQLKVITQRSRNVADGFVKPVRLKSSKRDWVCNPGPNV